MATVLQVADSIIAELNVTSFGQPFVAKRLYVPNFDLEDVSQLQVTVVPRDVEITGLDRRRDMNEISIDLAVQKKFTKGDAAEVDPLVGLVEEIADHFKHRRLDSFPHAIWSRSQHVVLYSPEHWEQLRQFTSLLTLVYRVAR